VVPRVGSVLVVEFPSSWKGKRSGSVCGGNARTRGWRVTKRHRRARPSAGMGSALIMNR
jgi:hypothetical protein